MGLTGISSRASIDLPSRVSVEFSATVSTPAGWSSGVAVVVTGSGTTSGTGVGSEVALEATSGAAFEGVLEPPQTYVQGAYHDPCRTANEERTTLGVEDAPMRQFEERRALVLHDDAESAVLRGTEENYEPPR